MSACFEFAVVHYWRHPSWVSLLRVFSQARDVTCTTTGGETFNVVYRLLPTADALPSGDLAPSAALGVTLFGNEVFRQPITVRFS